MSGLIYVFDKKVKSFKDNYLNLLFKYQDMKINTFLIFSNFNNSSFNLE